MKKTITYLLLLFAAITMNAQQWENVGGPSISAGLSGGSSIATDNNNIPYIAYNDQGNGLAAVVKKFNGTSWETVGGGVVSEGVAYYVDIAVDGTGLPIVAYLDQANGWKVTIKKFNGTSWVALGGTATPVQPESLFSFAIDASGDPYVAYSYQQKIYIRKFNGTAWENVGTDVITTGSFMYNPISIGFDYDVPYLAYKTFDGAGAVRKFNGTSWEFVGNQVFTEGIQEDLSLAIDNGIPYVVFSDGNYQGVVKFLNGNSWETVGTSFSDNPTNTAIAFRAGVPYIAYLDYWNSNSSVVKEFDGTSWTSVGGSVAGNAYSPAFAVGANDIYVVYSNLADNYKINVKKFASPCNTPAPQFESAIPTCTEGTFADIKIFAPQLNFYASEAADTALGEDDAIVPGTYYVSQTFGCESPRSPVDIVAGDCHARTQLEAASCGVTLPQIDTKIYATAVPSADAYIFVVSDGTNTRNVFSQYRYFRLIELEGGYAYNTTYTIRVVTMVNGQPGFAGAACTVTTPAQNTTLTAASCNSTVVNFGTNIYANSRSFAEGYRFRITNGASVQTIDRPNTYFRLNQLATYGYSTTYTVDVAVMINGEYGEYGPPCTVTTPAAISQLKATSCGITVASFSTNLYATAMTFADGYRFRITNGANVQTIEGSASYFRLKQLASYKYSTEYTVEVAVSVGGVYGNYGPACTVTTPAPITKLRAQDCGTTVAGFGTNLYADDMPLAQGYRFRVTNGATVDIVNWPTRNFRIKMLPSYTYNTTYTVEVAVLIDGVWSDYGPACEVTTPASAMRQNRANDEDAVRELTAFPNPFETSFSFALETDSDEPVTIQSYDLTGKMLDNRSIAPEELSDLKIGENYAAGIYSVIVTQGSFTKAVKMVKK